MRNTVRYEFTVETLVDYGDGSTPDDIEDVNFFDTLAEAKAFADDRVAWGEIVCLGLRRDEGNDIEGIVARGYAYPDESGKLPERVETAQGLQDEAPVPARFRRMTLPVYALHPMPA